MMESLPSFRDWLPLGIFYFFASLAVISAIMVVISKNSVRAVLFLILTFFATAGIWILLEAEFLAITLVLVYVGAVMVLFLFVVMMLDVELATLKEGFTRYLPLGIVAMTIILLGLAYVLSPKEFGFDQFPMPAPHPKDYSQATELGTFLYSKFLYPFEVAGILLLVAIVSAISLTFRGRRGSKSQKIDQQLKASKETRLRIVELE